MNNHYKNITICGWDSDTTDDSNIQGVRIIRDPLTMQCKGFAYVLFKDKHLYLMH